jgi:hypothetical protein
MKKLLLLSACCLIMLTSPAQYKHCLDNGIIKWSVLTEVLDYGEFSDNWMAYGDTVINDKTYKHLDRYDFVYSETADWQSDIPSVFPAGKFIRESEDASQLYVMGDRHSTSNTEYLVFDLNLEVGDTFQVPEIWDIYMMNYRTEITVDSVYVQDGLKHVQFDCEIFPPDYKLTFIEGIGPNIGFYSSEHWAYGELLNCFQNQSLFYKNAIQMGDGTIGFPCGYQTPLEEAVHVPATDQDYTIRTQKNTILIDFDTPSDIRLFIYDMEGKLYHAADFTAEKNIAVPVSSFPKGIYVLKIFNKIRNTINVNKIIL